VSQPGDYSIFVERRVACVAICVYIGYTLVVLVCYSCFRLVNGDTRRVYSRAVTDRGHTADF